MVRQTRRMDKFHTYRATVLVGLTLMLSSSLFFLRKIYTYYCENKLIGVIDMMDKIKEMIISAIIKKGVLYEGRNCDINIDIPNGDKAIKVNFKADNMSIKILSDD